jgi:ATP-binding cassette subfamily A (ABC1) protein 3
LSESFLEYNVKVNSEKKLEFLVPLLEQKNFTFFFEGLEKMEGLQVTITLNTLEDAFINIGKDQERFLIKNEEMINKKSNLISDE